MEKPFDVYNARLAYWHGQGKRGAELYEALAADPAIPTLWSESDAADVIGVTIHALRQRRQRKSNPTYLRISQSCVRYTREGLFGWLASSVVEGAAR